MFHKNFAVFVKTVNSYKQGTSVKQEKGKVTEFLL